MKIGLIVPGFSSDENDWCIPALLDLARTLAARHELHVVALHYPFRRDHYSVVGARVHAIGGANRRGWRLPGVLKAAANEIVLEHRRGRFDALHAFWVYEPGLIAVWLKRRLGVRVIVSVAGGELVDLPDIEYGLARRRWLLSLVRWTLRRADVATAGSKSLLNHVRRSVCGVGDRAVYAPLGVNTDLFTPPALHAEAPLVVMTVGSLQPVKAHADLIRAFRIVADLEPKARLKIVGEGVSRPALESLVAQLSLQDRVKLVGEIRHDRLPDMLGRASLYVQTSQHEAQGMAVLEAAACGLPIAGTPVGALSDLAPDAAIVTPPGDPNRLARTILKVLSDPLRRHSLGNAARACAEKTYSLEASAGRFESLYAP